MKCFLVVRMDTTEGLGSGVCGGVCGGVYVVGPFARFEFAKSFLLLFFVAFSWFPFFEHFFDHILFQFFFSHFWRCAGRYVGQWIRWLRGRSGGTFYVLFFFGQQWGWWCGGRWCSSTTDVFTGKTIVFTRRKLFFSTTFAFAVAGSSLGDDGVTG